MAVLRLVAGMVVASLAFSPAAGATLVITPRGTPAWLIRDAYTFARILNDASPRTIRITLGRYDTISIRGRFVCTKCHGLWTKPPTGTLARYVIDPRTRAVTSFSLRP